MNESRSVDWFVYVSWFFLWPFVLRRRLRDGPVILFGTLRDQPNLRAVLSARRSDFDNAEWMWCNKCERGYAVDDILLMGRRRRDGRWLACPVDNCRGDTPDFFPWTPYEWP